MRIIGFLPCPLEATKDTSLIVHTRNICITLKVNETQSEGVHFEQLKVRDVVATQVLGNGRNTFGGALA